MGDKEQLVSEGAGHADAMYELSDAYWEAVFSFVNRYIEQWSLRIATTEMTPPEDST